MSALRNRPITKNMRVTSPARTAAASGVPKDSANLRYRTKIGGNERSTVVTEFISTFAAKTSRGLTGEVKT